MMDKETNKALGILFNFCLGIGTFILGVMALFGHKAISMKMLVALLVMGVAIIVMRGR